MEILFIILKIIGVLLAIVLLLCLALLLVPIRYRVELKAQDEIEGKAAVHWLFHLLDVRVFYRERDISFKIRIFGITVPLDKGKKTEEAEPREPVKQAAGREKAEQGAGREEAEENAEQTAGREDAGEKAIQIGQALPEQKAAMEEPEGTEEQTAAVEGPEGAAGQKAVMEEPEGTAEQSKVPGSQSHRPRSFKENDSKGKRRKKHRKKPGLFHKIKSSFHNFGKRVRKTPGRKGQRHSGAGTGAAAAKEQIGNIKNMILEETNQNAFLCMMQEVRYLLRHYLPGKVTGTLRFSMGSPDQTGKALGTISLLPFWARSKLVVMPDFVSEAFYMKGILYITGRVRFLHALISGIRMIRDRNVRKLIANIRS